MLRILVMLAAPVVALSAPAVAQAQGNAPVKIRNGTSQDIWVTVDNTGRGLQGPSKVMKDGRTAVLVKPGAQVIAKETSQFDKPTLYAYDKDGNLMGTGTFLIVPIGGAKWERKWNGSEFIDDPNG